MDDIRSSYQAPQKRRLFLIAENRKGTLEGQAADPAGKADI
jgi:hypothetical protein